MPAADLSSVLLLSSLIACAVVSGEGGGGAAQSLIDGTQSSNVYHLDLLQRPDDASKAAPWFDGFGGGVAVATVGHPLRRMLLHLRKDGIGLEEGMSWAKTGAIPPLRLIRSHLLHELGPQRGQFGEL